MPLKPDFPDDYAALREEVRRLRFAVAAAAVEITAATSSDETIAINAQADSGWQSLSSGPSLQVTAALGKIVVTVGGRIKIPSSNTGAIAVISYAILDANNVQVVAPDLYRGPAVEYKGAGSGASVQSSFTYVHDGLAPGTYTIKTQYRYWDGSGGATGTFTADFINRALIAKGY